MSHLACKIDEFRSFCDMTHRIDCSGCADSLDIPAGRYIGQPFNADLQRYELWKRIDGKMYCKECAFDMEKQMELSRQEAEEDNNEPEVECDYCGMPGCIYENGKCLLGEKDDLYRKKWEKVQDRTQGKPC